mgnify:CR=1 FL=1
MEAAQWIDALGSFLGALAAFAALAAASKQLVNLNKTLRQTVLASVIQLESELGNRKHLIDQAAREVRELADDPNTQPAKLRAAYDHMQSCLEDWFNTTDRLAFCIVHKYVKEKEWKPEYFPYISNIIENHSKHFEGNTQYKNIVKLARRWGLLTKECSCRPHPQSPQDAVR